MSLPMDREQRFCVSGTLGATDESLTLKAAVASFSYYITGVILTSLTAAAQTVFVGDSSGTVKAISVAASFTVHAQARMQVREGLKLTAGEALIVKPAAAGPSVHVVVEGYIVRN